MMFSLRRIIPIVLGAVALMACYSAPASAQATRTWVSGVGDDANPCSRTAPCKTWAGAIAKTAPAGEINCLDPGGFGALTITKAIAIICQGGTGGVLTSGTNGFVVAAGVNDLVYIQGLDFEGLNTSLSGILFNSGKGLHIKDCIIRGYTTGISITPNQTASVVIQNTVVTHNTGGGILIAPTNGTTTAEVAGTQMVANGSFGMRVQDNSKVTVFDSASSDNTTNGILAASTSAAISVNVMNSVLSGNGTNGAITQGTLAVLRLFNTAVVDNTTGVNVSGGIVGGTTPGTNLNGGNVTGGAPNQNATLQ